MLTFRQKLVAIVAILVLLGWSSRIFRGERESVLVTGGFGIEIQKCKMHSCSIGFIGSHVVDMLLSQGYKVYILDDESTGRRRNPGAINYIGDISNDETFQALSDLKVSD
jgi:nucleoside-diphosphate-sugar epimerase